MSEIFSKILKDKNGKTLNVGSQYNQPDWGSEGEMKELYPEMTLAPMAPDEPMAPFVTAPTNIPAIGDTAKIMWNGTEYTCTGVMYAEGDIEVGVMFGNAGAMIEGAAVTDEPFLFVVLFPEYVEAMGFPAMCVILDGSTSITFAASIGSMTYHRIPSEYVGTYNQPKWGKEKDAVVLRETEITSTQQDITTPFTLEIGKEYMVLWNGTKYNAIAKDLKGKPCLGNLDKGMGIGDTGEPFFLARSDEGSGVYGVVVVYDDSVPATVSITENLMHKIPKDYMDTSISVTYSEEGLNYTFNGYTFDEVCDAIDAGKIVYVSPRLYPEDKKICVRKEDDALTFISFENAFYEAGYTFLVVCDFYRSGRYLRYSYELNLVSNGTISADAINMVSPNGTVYNVTVSDDGTLTVTKP